MKTYGRAELQLHVSVTAMEVSGQINAPPLYPLYPLDNRLGGPQNRSGRCEEDDNFALLGIETGPSSP
jgi:hypothetical protein